MHPAAAGPRRRAAGVAGRGRSPRPRPAILALAGRLLADGVELVVMEATSDYWRIWYYLLEGAGLNVQLVNPSHARQLAGRPKTDRLDAQWIARLAEMGLLRPSFVPPPEIRALRDLTRTRLQLVRDRTREWQRLEKLLEGALVKLSSVVSLAGEGQDRPRHPGGHRRRRARPAGPGRPGRTAHVKGGRAAVEESLEGMALGAHHPMLIRVHLDHITLLDRQIAAVDDEIEAALDAIPAAWGVERRRRPVRRPGPGRRGAARRRAARGDPRRQPRARHGDHRRDRPGHDPVPDRRPPRVLGRARPRRPPVRPPQPQAEERTGRRLPQGLLHPGRQRRRPHRHLPRRTAPPPVQAPRRQQGQVRRRPAPSWSSSGTCSPTPTPGSPTSAPTGTTAKPTATARSAPTSASSRPSALERHHHPRRLNPKPRRPGPQPSATGR